MEPEHPFYPTCTSYLTKTAADMTDNTTAVATQGSFA